MVFHEVRFPTRISLQSTGGPERRTEIITLASGFEERNSPWAQSRRRYNAGYGVKSLADIETVLAFFEARHGPLNGFRWKDPFDWRSAAFGATIAPTDQTIGTGDGAEVVFQLTKTYASGAQSYSRAIKKPVDGTVRVALDGVEASLGADYVLDPATGRITFATAPGAGAAVTAGFEFDTPVRFDTDQLEINLAAFEAGDIPSIPLVEVLLP